MKTITSSATLLILFGVLLLTKNTSAQTQTLDWALSSGSVGNDRIYSLMSSTNGLLYTAGDFSNTVDFNPNGNSFNLSSNGGQDAFICQYSFNRSLNWAVSFGSSNGNELIRNITIDNVGNVYATGQFQNTVDFDPDTSSSIHFSNGSDDVFVVKYDQQGNHLWTKTFGGSSEDRGLYIETHPNGTILISGYYRGNVDFDPSTLQDIRSGNSGENAFITALDTNGSYLWTNTYKSSSNHSYINRGYSINVNNQGDILFCGSFVGNTDFDPSNNFMTYSSNGGEDAFLTKLSPNGSMIWTKSWGGYSECIPTDVKTDQNDNIYVSGLFRSSVDFNPDVNTSLTRLSNGHRDMFISKFDTNGVLLWNRTVGSVSADALAQISIDNDGFVFGTGYFYTSFDADPDSNNTSIIQSQGDSDAFYWELDSSGNFISAHSIGGSGNDLATGIAFDGSNGIFVGGAFSSTVDFDPDTSIYNRSSNGSRDFFIQKISVCKTTIDSINAFGCQFYISPSSKLISSSGIYMDTIPNQNGCDSVLKINVTLNQLNTSVTSNDPDLYANTNQSVSYQWLNCSNNFAAIPGATQSTYTATQNGYYAVEITQGQCKDTSNCHQIISVGINDFDNVDYLSFHPNPSNGSFNADLSDDYLNANYTVYNLQGKIIEKGKVEIASNFQLNIKSSEGLYIVKFESRTGTLLSTHKIVKR